MSQRRQRAATKEIRQLQREQVLAQMHRSGRGRDTSAELLEQVDALFHRFGQNGRRTRRRYLAVWRDLARFVGERYGLRRLGDLQPEHIAQYVGERRSGAGARQVKSIVATLFRYVPGAEHERMAASLWEGGVLPRTRGRTPLLLQAQAAAKRVRGYAGTTMARYRVSWLRFSAWLEDRNVVADLQQVKPEHIEAFAQARRAQGATEAAVALDRRAIRGILWRRDSAGSSENGVSGHEP